MIWVGTADVPFTCLNLADPAHALPPVWSELDRTRFRSTLLNPYAQLKYIWALCAIPSLN